MRSTRRSRSSRPWREWDLTSPHQAARLRRGAPDPDRQGQARRGAVLGRRQPAAHLLRGQGAGGPGRGGAATTSTSAPSTPRRRPTSREYVEIDFERGDPVSVDGEALSPAALLDPAQRARRPARRRPARPRREPLRRHEVARHLRDPGRHDPARGPPRHRADHARPRRGAPQGRADAALRRADLQRLLVLARARDAAGADRPEPGARRGHGAAQALQGLGQRRRPHARRSRSTPSATSPSRTTPAPTTRRTRRASSSSTRCACGSWRCATGG